MTSPLLQEAAKVLQDAYSEWMTQHGHAMHWEQFCAAALFRWLLTREPTEGMVEAGMVGAQLAVLRADKRNYAAAYRAMNAALLKEVEG